MFNSIFREKKPFCRTFCCLTKCKVINADSLFQRQIYFIKINIRNNNMIITITITNKFNCCIELGYLN